MGLIGHLAMGIGRGTGGRPLTAPARVNDQKATSQDGLLSVCGQSTSPETLDPWISPSEHIDFIGFFKGQIHPLAI